MLAKIAKGSRTVVLVAVAMIAITSIGCYSASTGTKIEKTKLTQITKGVTTRAQVEEMFGPPMHVAMRSNGGRMMMYSGTETSGSINLVGAIPLVGLVAPGQSKDRTRTQSLQIMLNKDDVVEDYEFNDNTRNTTMTSSAFGAHAESSSTGSDASPSNK